MKTFTSIQKANENGKPIQQMHGTNYILKMLYQRYAEEILQWYHYMVVAPFLVGSERPNIEKKFNDFADDELNDHAMKLLKRINELGGNIEMIKNLDALKTLSECQYAVQMEPYDTRQLITANIEHEKCAIEGYKKLCELTHGEDPVTYDIAVNILADEEEHLRDLKDFLADQNLNH